MYDRMKRITYSRNEEKNMKITPVVPNYSQRTNLKSNQPTFGAAKVNTAKIMDVVEESHKEPLKQFFTKLFGIETLKKEINKASENIELNVHLTDAEKGIFNLILKKGGAKDPTLSWMVDPRQTADFAVREIGHKFAREMGILSRN